METRIVHYPNREQMEQGVRKLGGEGWVLQTLCKISDEAIRAEFVRLEVTRAAQNVEWTYTNH